MAVSANGGADGTGIFWMTAGDHSAPGVPGTLYAFNASDLTQLLWSSEMNARRDRLGRFAKFANPTVANGRVFVSTFSNELVIYGPLEFGGPRPVRLH
jgi:outer membrane protein assembly factor BamB